jgi:peptidoglycan lytic transglycosylase G
VDSARYMAVVRDPEVIKSLGVEGTSLEGYLLPETYLFNWELEELDVVRRQVGQFWVVFNDSLKRRAEELGWTVREAITFASIIEGEAGLDEERPIISGVYHNRLRRGMKLEADPTIQYLVEGGPRRLFYSDLKIDNPYNTYIYAGLPPGPVNNPGKASILAALYPAQHEYLYFVANGRGGHRFSKTYSEHMKNVRRYRRDRAQLSGNAKGPTNS